MAKGRGYGTMLECMKWTMVIYNFVYWVLGAVTAGVGIWIVADVYQGIYYKALDIKIFYVAAYLMIVAGLVMIIMSFLGCLGSVRESRTLLKVYFGIMAVVFIVIVIAVFWTFLHGVKGSALNGIITRQLTRLVDTYAIDDYNRYLMDTIQSYMECCGIENYNDYIMRNLQIPDSCRDMITGQQHYWGCWEQATMWVESKAALTGTLTIIVALAQIMGMIFTVCLMKEIQKDTLN